MYIHGEGHLNKFRCVVRRGNSGVVLHWIRNQTWNQMQHYVAPGLISGILAHACFNHKLPICTQLSWGPRFAADTQTNNIKITWVCLLGTQNWPSSVSHLNLSCCLANEEPICLLQTVDFWCSRSAVESGECKFPQECYGRYLYSRYLLTP